MLNENEKAFKKTQRDFYAKEAAAFDFKKRRENRNHFNKISAISDFLTIVDGDHVLEVGTGTGIHATSLMKKNMAKFRLTCSDLSPQMLSEARKKNECLGSVDFVVLEGERLPFPDQCFDKVFLSGALHHFFDPTRGVSELLRVLKKNGRFCIMEPNYLFPTNFIGTWTHREERGLRQMTRGKLSGWLDAYGIDYEIINFAYTPPFPVWMHPCWDFLDSVLHRIPYLRKISVMLLVRGIKT